MKFDSKMQQKPKITFQVQELNFLVGIHVWPLRLPDLNLSDFLKGWIKRLVFKTVVDMYKKLIAQIKNDFDYLNLKIKVCKYRQFVNTLTQNLNFSKGYVLLFNFNILIMFRY